MRMTWGANITPLPQILERIIRLLRLYPQGMMVAILTENNMISKIAAVLAILFAPVMVFGQALADHVPGDAMVYVGWRGVADLGPGYPASNLKAVLDDSDIRQFIDEFLPAVIDRIGHENQDAAGPLKILATIAKPSWQRPTAFFFAGIDLPQGGPPVPHLGVLWQPGADADALMQQLQQLTAQAQPPFPLKVVHVGDLIALMVGYDNPEAALAGGSKSLAENAAFKAALGHVMKDPVVALYIDYDKFLGTLTSAAKVADPNAGDMIGKVFKDLGVDGLKRLILTSGVDGKDWGTMAFIEAPEPRSGLLTLVASKPMDDAILSAIPMSSTMAGAGRADVSQVLPTIRKTLEDLHPQIAEQVNQMLKSIAQQSDVDIEKDLINSLGDEWAYFTDPGTGGYGLASLTLVNRLKDPAKFEQSLSKIEDFALQQIEQQMGPADKLQIRFQTVKLDGVTVHYLAVPLISPSWVVKDGMLYVSPYPQVAAAAARRGASADTSILKNESFVALRQRLGHNEATGITFDDLPRTAPQAYGGWLMISRLAGFGDLFGIKSPPILMPELGKLMAHLSPAGSVKWVDADGIHMQAIEPFPASTVVASDPAISAIYAEPVMVATLLPALNKAREQANQVKSINNLAQIGRGAFRYANAHEGKFPPDLAAIARQGGFAASTFVNPRTSHPMPPPNVRSPEEVGAWAGEHSDYVYVGAGKTVNDPADVIIGYERPDGLTDGINILFADGHCERTGMPKAIQMLQRGQQIQ